MGQRVTKRQAEAALRAVEKQFKRYLEPIKDPEGEFEDIPPMCPPPKLSMDWDGHVAILWEDGPDEWAYRATMGGTSEEERCLVAAAAQEFGKDPKQAVAAMKVDAPMKWPKGVYAEPYNSFILCLYPD
jgi:hypothetical protein